MAEYPIIFSAAMVRALLAGAKTQTRRLVTSRNALIDGARWSDNPPVIVLSFRVEETVAFIEVQ